MNILAWALRSVASAELDRVAEDVVDADEVARLVGAANEPADICDDYAAMRRHVSAHARQTSTHAFICASSATFAQDAAHV